MIYRDLKTGRFARKTTWRRSVNAGGRRYRRERVPQRRRPVSVATSGYRVLLEYVSADNGFVLYVRIRPYKRLSDADVVKLILKLLRAGHFDDSEESSTKDLKWTAFLVNYDEILSRSVSMSRGTAVLEGFERTA